MQHEPLITCKIKEINEIFQPKEVLKTSPRTAVFLAAHAETGQEVALKVIGMPGIAVSGACQQRFIRTMRALQSLRLHCCPDLYEFGLTPEGSTYMVMDVVRGIGLDKLAGMPPAQTIPLLMGLVGALEILVAEGIHHHNLCGDNVLVVEQEGGDSIRLLGLGTAACLAEEEGGPLPAEERGDNRYAPPEKHDPSLRHAGELWRSDLYSVAMVICDTLGARVNAPGTVAPGVDLAVCRGLGRQGAQLGMALDTALQRDPAARQLTYAMLRDALGRAMPPRPSGDQVQRTQLLSTPGAVAAQPPAAPPAPPPPPVDDSGKETVELPLAQLTKDVAPPPAPVADDNDSQETSQLPRAQQATEKTEPGQLLPPVVTEPDSDDSRETAQLPRAQLADKTDPAMPLPAPVIADDSDSRATDALPRAQLAPPAAPPTPATVRFQIPGQQVAPPPAAPAPPPVQPPAAHPAPPATPPAAPRPEPVPAPAPQPEATGKPSAPSKLLLIVVGVVGSLIMVGLTVVAAIWAYRHFRQSEQPVAPTPVAVATPLPQPTPEPEPDEPLMAPQLELANNQLLAGDTDGAKQTLESLTDEELQTLSEEEQAFYQDLMASFSEEVDLSVAASDLAIGLDQGSVKMIGRVLTTLSGVPESDIASEPGLLENLELARQVMQNHREMWAAKHANNTMGMLELACRMVEMLPRYSGGHRLREEAAATLAATAETAIKARDLDRAIDQLEIIRKLWPDRPGLAERIDWCRQQQGTERRLESVLRSAQSSGAQGDPEEGLRLLASVQPTPRFTARFQEARQALERQLAALDAKPPSIAIKGDVDLRFKKNQTIRIPLSITDDYRVTTTTAIVKTATSGFTEVKLEHTVASTYLLVVPPALHGNKTFFFYVTATDRAGHSGSLGSRDNPIEVKKKGLFGR